MEEAHFTVEPVEEVVALPCTSTKVALKLPVLSPLNRSEVASKPASKHTSIASSKHQLLPAREMISRDDSQQQLGDESTIVLSSTEKENLRYNMREDKVVVFYKKILGEIRDVIREERSNIKKYLR